MIVLYHCISTKIHIFMEAIFVQARWNETHTRAYKFDTKIWLGAQHGYVQKIVHSIILFTQRNPIRRQRCTRTKPLFRANTKYMVINKIPLTMPSVAAAAAVRININCPIAVEWNEQKIASTSFQWVLGVLSKITYLVDIRDIKKYCGGDRRDNFAVSYSYIETGAKKLWEKSSIV